MIGKCRPGFSRSCVSSAFGMRLRHPLQLDFRCSFSAASSKSESGDGERRPYGHHEEEFFNFTRGRFVSNEDHEMSQRYVRFNVHELARVAAEAVGSKSCIAIEKYPDGWYNKALLMTMDDGTQTVAKIPNPNAGRSHFTTASEVATTEFVSVAKSIQEYLY